MDNDIIFMDRVGIIRDTINKYGENHFYISFSGGKDSTILSALVDYALPDNKIPRVFCDTGIEHKAIREFVRSKALVDTRFVIIKPETPVSVMLRQYGYPFKSKLHSNYVSLYQKGSKCQSLKKYVEGGYAQSCPDLLKYQFKEGVQFPVSSMCCQKMKKEPFHKYVLQSGRECAIMGLRTAEGGQRALHTGCAVFDGNSIVKFKPLNPCDDSFMDYVQELLSIELCKLYYLPYNFKRTGCVGCPYNPNLEEDLEVMREFLPNEYKQCFILWKPVYDEYIRLGYRLHKYSQMSLFGGQDVA